MRLSNEDLDLYLREISLDTEIILIILQRIEKKMDKEIKGVKKSIDKKMNKLVKDDIKRDKKCEHEAKMAKKKK